MNRNSRNDENDNDQIVRGFTKITYWEKYGVKRFPYSGRRRYSPCVYQSEDGGIIISNDVFGLTIKQVERTYKECLDRRKAHEQYILNIRYPDKTSTEYMEYLENSRYCQDYLSCTEDDLKERYLYQNLVNTVGTEIDIRKRQQLFIIQDMICNAQAQKTHTHISSGSLAEGLDLPGSDIDIMFVINKVDVIRDLRNMRHPVQCTTLVMETDTDHPGFSRLRLIAIGDGENDILTYEYFESTSKGLCLSVNKFVSKINNMIPQQQISQHGPCLSDKGQNVDIAVCLRSKYLPYNAIPWASRYRQQWPPNSTIDTIKKYGCLLVPIGPRDMSDFNVLWRLSFSVAEKLLVHSFNFTQLLCYCLLKLTLKHIVNTNRHAEGLLCSYFLKTALFWVSEEIDIDTFQLSKLYFCFSLCLDKLKMWVQKCYCPNYFIPEHNMFLGKIGLDNNIILINVLDNIKCDGIDGLIQNICSHNNGMFPLSCLLRTNSNYSSIRLDFLFFKISELCPIDDIFKLLKALMFTETLIKSKYSAFIIDVCKHHHAVISQYAAQLQPKPAITTEMYNIHKHYHRFLQQGIKTDAVSGWLLYASFYYVTGQYNVTLKLTDYVLSKCSSDLVLTYCVNYSEKELKKYRKHVNSTMTLHDKMRIATIRRINYARQSLLIPRELQLEVNKRRMFIPLTVMSHCLRFLCYHHLCDISNRQQALRELCLSVKDKHFVLSNTLSSSLTVLGVCYEIAGDKDTAYQCYDDALQCDAYVCLSAGARKSKLLEM
ncbi:Hypothetical predicted protein [Mytilus galloprovincialis]|uniref:Mab-21-like HhH/H2TH-like domain-containing protein n=1 Tax=Mytilus galloprovincialis TaxID=29158 RepID=A0A8B6E4E0_MYTGA|nr:Hypothetical predicted protein [Mytilus galloprovincialis]